MSEYDPTYKPKRWHMWHLLMMAEELARLWNVSGRKTDSDNQVFYVFNSCLNFLLPEDGNKLTYLLLSSIF